jgi:hypothetical protein
MIFRKAVFIVAAVALATTASASAYAQAGVYGMFTVDRLSNIASSPLPAPTTTGPNARLNSADPLGGTGGVYYDFMKLGPVRLGADLRGSEALMSASTTVVRASTLRSVAFAPSFILRSLR